MIGDQWWCGASNYKAPRIYKRANPTDSTSFLWKEGDRGAVEVGRGKEFCFWLPHFRDFVPAPSLRLGYHPPFGHPLPEEEGLSGGLRPFSSSQPPPFGPSPFRRKGVKAGGDAEFQSAAFLKWIAPNKKTPSPERGSFYFHYMDFLVALMRVIARISAYLARSMSTSASWDASLASARFFAASARATSMLSDSSA